MRFRVSASGSYPGSQFAGASVITAYEENAVLASYSSNDLGPVLFLHCGGYQSRISAARFQHEQIVNRSHTHDRL